MFNVSSSSNLVYCISLISTFDNTQRKILSFNVRLFEIDSDINLKKSVDKFKQIKDAEQLYINFSNYNHITQQPQELSLPTCYFSYTT